MYSTDFKVLIDGVSYFGLLDVNVTRSIESLCGAFSINITAIEREDIPEIVPGALIEISISNKKIIYGYIDGIDATLSESQSEISISGRDRTGDLVDCSIANTPFNWDKKTLKGLAEIICASFNIEILADSSISDYAETFTSEIGESPFELFSRAAKDRGILLLTSLPSGKLWLTNVGTVKCFDGLEYGKNIKSISFNFEYANRFYKYIVKGQKTSEGVGWTSSNVNIQKEEFDQNIRNTRVKVFQAESQSSLSSVTSRVRFEAISRAAQSESMTIEVIGYTQSNGDLWRENFLVDVIVNQGVIRISGEYLIVSVSYSLSNSGKITTLKLKRKDAYTKEPNLIKKKSQGLIWA